MTHTVTTAAGRTFAYDSPSAHADAEAWARDEDERVLLALALRHLKNPTAPDWVEELMYLRASSPLSAPPHPIPDLVEIDRLWAEYLIASELFCLENNEGLIEEILTSTPRLGWAGETGG